MRHFRQLQDALLRHLLDRIAEGEFSGIALARRTGFRQAHISNFLNRRRGLSLEAMDRILEVLGLSILDLVDAVELRASVPGDADYENVFLVTPQVAIAQSVISRSSVLEILKFKKTFLRRLRPDPASPRQDWTRFVLIRAEAGNGNAMRPRMTATATLLIDRQYNSLRPYRGRAPNIYAVDRGGSLLVRYVELQGSQLLLRPHNEQTPLSSVAIAKGKSFADYIVGRVCHVAFET